MFEGNRLSSYPVPARYTGAGVRPTYRTVDFEDGPIFYGDTSAGASYQVWGTYLRDGVVWIEAPTSRLKDALLAAPYNLITDVSIAFNMNADLHVVWVEQGETFFRWYSTLDAKFIVWKLPEGTRTPRLTLDDKRPSATSVSDIILSYIDSTGRLLCRIQRDRFGIEYVLDDGPYLGLDKVYFSVSNRLQWECSVGTFTQPAGLGIKTYVRKWLTPDTTEGWTGYTSTLPTSRIEPLGQALDTRDSVITDLVWHRVTGEFVIEFDVEPVLDSDEESFIDVYVHGLCIRCIYESRTVYRTILMPDELQELNRHELRPFDIVLDFPTIINATQEF